MSVERLLASLNKVRGRNGSWTACCPAHADRTPSLAVRVTTDGRVLVHCFAGCNVEEVVGAVGMSIEDLFPERETDPVKPARSERQRFFAGDLLRVIEFEALVVAVAAHDIATGKPMTPADLERIRTASVRINEALTAANIQ
jgi:hypothetical protein